MHGYPGTGAPMCGWVERGRDRLRLLARAVLATQQELQSKELPTTRIQPDRRWFGNTRVVGQKQLEQFREEMSSKVSSASFGWH